MDSYEITNARVYVSTEKRYTRHNRFGTWVELAGFDRKKDYIEYCGKLFPDEPEPAVIHLDWQEIPPFLISQEEISAKVFRLIGQAGNMEETRRKGFAVWLARQHREMYTRKTIQIVQSFTGHYMGYFGYELQFAEYYAEETMGITRKGSPRFDFISYANRLFKDRFVLDKGFVFQKDKNNSNVVSF